MSRGFILAVFPALPSIYTSAHFSRRFEAIRAPSGSLCLSRFICPTFDAFCPSVVRRSSVGLFPYFMRLFRLSGLIRAIVLLLSAFCANCPTFDAFCLAFLAPMAYNWFVTFFESCGLLVGDKNRGSGCSLLFGAWFRPRYSSFV